MSLAGKVALITGGTKGIGAAIAAKFVKEGASVVVNYGRDSAAADALVSKLGDKQVLAVQGDQSKIADLEKMVKATVDKFGKIDVLIPNAGTMPMMDLEHLTEEGWQRIMDVNAKGPIFLAQKAVPHMPSGSVILFVSTTLTAAQNYTPGYLPYMASKGAIEQSVRVLSKDLAKKGIRVNAFAPGPTATELFLEGKPEALINQIKSMNPFGQLGDPEDIASFVALLANSDAKWLSGQTIRINGAAA